MCLYFSLAVFQSKLKIYADWFAENGIVKGNPVPGIPRFVLNAGVGC